MLDESLFLTQLFNFRNEIYLTLPLKYMRGYERCRLYQHCSSFYSILCAYRYGQSNGVFSFETGRQSQGGAKTYFFTVTVHPIKRIWFIFVIVYGCLCAHRRMAATSMHTRIALLPRKPSSLKALPPPPPHQLDQLYVAAQLHHPIIIHG